VSVGRSIGYAIAMTVLGVLVANHLFAIPVTWSIALSLPLGGVVLLGGLLSGAADANWEPAPAAETTRTQLMGSTLAVRLAEAATDQHRFTTRVRPRLQRMALAVLRGRPGLADLTGLDDPRARAALGDDLHTLLTDDRTPLPEPRRLAAMLARLEDP
jgi:hypothetical protein